MPYEIEYFHRRVEAEIEGWPVGILAHYARLVELLEEFGPNIKCHTRSRWESNYLSYGHADVKVSVVLFTVSSKENVWSYFMPSLRKPKKLPSMI